MRAPWPTTPQRMRVARKAQAQQFAANILPIIRDIQAAATPGHSVLVSPELLKQACDYCNTRSSLLCWLASVIRPSHVTTKKPSDRSKREDARLFSNTRC
jgi:hypothetical protein